MKKGHRGVDPEMGERERERERERSAWALRGFTAPCCLLIFVFALAGISRTTGWRHWRRVPSGVSVCLRNCTLHRCSACVRAYVGCVVYVRTAKDGRYYMGSCFEEASE